MSDVADAVVPVAPGKIRLTADVAADDIEILQSLAKTKHISLTEALSLVINSRKQLDDLQSTGKLLVERNGSLSQLVFGKR